MPAARLLACVATIVLAGTAAAHELRPLIATLTLDDRSFELTLSLNLEAAMSGIGPEHTDTASSPAAPEYDRLRALDPAALGARFDAFAAALLDRVALTFDGTPAALEIADVRIPPVGDRGAARISEVVLTGAVPVRAETLGWRVEAGVGDSAIRVRAAGSGATLHSAFARAGEPAAPFALGALAPMSPLALIEDYLRLGFVHIVPRGLDHIAFVVGLFLLSTRLSSLLWQVSAFTVAHTITLALGITGMVTVSPAIVEPLIAASIVYVAVDNVLTDRLHRWRPVVVFGFGLLHGLGFAGVLSEIGLPPGLFVAGLVAFNVGVELGQIAVIAACFAAVGWARRYPWYRPRIAIPASLAIAVLASYWLVERTIAA